MSVTGHPSPKLLFAATIILTLCHGSVSYAAGPGEAAPDPYADQPYLNVTPAAPDPDFITIYTGYEFVEDSNFFYAGFIAAANGDLARPGFLIQGFGGFGDYEYRNSGVPGGTVNADLTELSGLLGYQLFAGTVRFRAFAGVDWQDNDLSPPDPANPVSGSDTNFVTTGNITTVGPGLYYFDLFGSYAVTNQTYWSRARIGYKFGHLTAGPEGAFYGNENFNSQRVGGFLKFPLWSRMDVTVAGGFNFVANDEFFDELGSGSFGGLGGISDGGYGNISISTWF